MLESFYNLLASIEATIQTALQLHHRLIIFILIVIVLYFIFDEKEDNKQHEEDEKLNKEYMEKIKQNDEIMNKLVMMTDEERNTYINELRKKNETKEPSLPSQGLYARRMITGAIIAELLRSGDVSRIVATAMISGAATCATRFIK